MENEHRRLVQQLNSTPTGQGLMAGALVMPITDSARTDTVGVPRGAVNLYRDGSTLVLQAFDFDAGTWRSTTLGSGGGTVAWVDITGKPSDFTPSEHGNEAHSPDFTSTTDFNAHTGNTSNPHSVTAADVGAPTTAVFNDHSARHENGGDDEISVAGLSGELADAQTPKTHASTHADGGTDEVAVEGLPTASTTTTHVFKPDGVGGAGFAALVDGDIPSTIARDSEVTAAIAAITPADIGAPSAEAGAGSIWVQSSQPTANATGDLWVETA